MILKILTIITLLLLVHIVPCGGQVSEKGKNRGDVNLQNTIRAERATIYKRFSDASRYVTLRVLDIRTGKVMNMVMENRDLALFLASEKGLTVLERGKIKDPGALRDFLDEDYVNFMVNNEGQVISIDLERYMDFLASIHHGKSDYGRKYLEEHVFDQPMTLAELGVEDERQLVGKYFDFDEKGRFGILKSYRNLRLAAFIATLIGLGYSVSRGDYIPALIIQKDPPSKND